MTALRRWRLGLACVAGLSLLGLLLGLNAPSPAARARTLPPTGFRPPQAAATPLVLQEGPVEDDNGVYVVAWAPDGARLPFS